MAKPKNAGGSRTLPVALELLEADHRKVEALFESYEDEKEGDDEEKRSIAAKICGELTVHAQVEEEIFYPWVRENLAEDDMEMVEEAQVEHAGAKDLIGQIEDASSIDATYDAKVKVLSEYIKHHVKEEESEMFPKLADFKEELDELGQQMHARKAELRTELGLEDEGGKAVPPKARGQDGQSSGRGATRGQR